MKINPGWCLEVRISSSEPDRWRNDVSKPAHTDWVWKSLIRSYLGRHICPEPGGSWKSEDPMIWQRGCSAASHRRARWTPDPSSWPPRHEGGLPWCTHIQHTHQEELNRTGSTSWSESRGEGESESRHHTWQDSKAAHSPSLHPKPEAHADGHTPFLHWFMYLNLPQVIQCPSNKHFVTFLSLLQEIRENKKSGFAQSPS